MSDQGLVATIFIGIFYGGVVSIILISFWKIQMASKDLKEIKKILADVQLSLEEHRR